MMATSKIATLLTSSGFDIQSLEVNRTIRRLSEAELVVTDMGAPVTGKKAKSRGRALKSLRVGVANSESMQLIRDLLHTNSLEEYLQDQRV